MQKTNVNSRDNDLKVIVFKACHVAVWSDAKMTYDERWWLLHLTEALCETQAERKIFREIQLQEINEDLLLKEIEPLSKEDKAYIFDMCLETLAIDKRIELQELRFLTTLRKACGVGYWAYRKKLAKIRKKLSAWIFPVKTIFSFFLIIMVLFVISLFMRFTSTNSADIFQEKCSSKEVFFTVLSPNDVPVSEILTAEDVFDNVRDGIVSVTVFVNYTPVSGGSGSVIGIDESDRLYIITNKHVIYNSYIKERAGKKGRMRIEVKQASGAKFDATLDFYSREHDLALLSVEGMTDYARLLHLNLKSGLQIGRPVYAIGSPIGLDHSFTAGVISALRETYLQTDATIHSGSSGGPLVDQYGALCAVVTKGHATKDYGFALYSDAILEVLEERKELKMNESPKTSEHQR